MLMASEKFFYVSALLLPSRYLFPTSSTVELIKNRTSWCFFGFALVILTADYVTLGECCPKATRRRHAQNVTFCGSVVAI